MEKPNNDSSLTGLVPAEPSEAAKPTVRHNLPQMAAFTTSRLAISKASVKESTNEIVPFANIVSMDELEPPPPPAPAEKVPETDQNMNTPDQTPDSEITMESSIDTSMEIGAGDGMTVCEQDGDKKPSEEEDVVPATAKETDQLDKESDQNNAFEEKIPQTTEQPAADTSERNTEDAPSEQVLEPKSPSKSKKKSSKSSKKASKRSKSENSLKSPDRPKKKKDEDTSSPTSPIKLKIRRSIQEGKSLLTSTVTLEDAQIKGSSFSPVVTFPVVKTKTKTKALLKGQSRKKLSQKQAELAEGTGSVDPEGEGATNQDPVAATAPPPATVPVKKPDTQPVVPEAKWLVGDLVWTKVSGHPWWPCMVSFDPITGQYVQYKGGPKPFYHVQFFGEAAERGWVAEYSMLDYEGKEALEHYCKEMCASTKSKVLKRKFAAISSCRRKGWDIAILSADAARPLSRHDRKVQFTFDYHIPDKKPKAKSPAKKTEKNQKRKARDNEDGQEGIPPTKKRKQSLSISLPSQDEAQFIVFCRKRRPALKEEHLEFSEKEIKAALKAEWKQMPAEEKLTFIPMGEDVSKLGDSMTLGVKVKSGRVSKPTQKKLERDVTSSDIGTSDSETEERLTKRKKKVISAIESDVTDTEAEKAKNKASRSFRISMEERERDLEILKLSGAGPTKKENICQICEKPDDLITCEGLCFQSFHLNCIGLQVQPTGPFKCDECFSGTHTCFVCRVQGKDTKRCSRPGCGKFYHDACIRSHPLTKFENNHFTCPLHTCATCWAENPKNPKATKGRFFRCVKCPTAYHVGDYCIAAGSEPLAGFNITCSNHFTPLKTKKYLSHLNVSWCFLCSLGGTLLCCERCPASFHQECLKIDTPEGVWNCPDCARGKRPLYGEIVWVKVGAYRWWPGEVCHPLNVPLNIQDMPHTTGEFPIRFFGSNDYYWITHARVFFFQDGDKGTRDTASAKSLDKTFQRAVQESVAAFRVWQKLKEEREEVDMVKNDKKPPPYKHIKSNTKYGNVTIKTSLEDIPRCECNPFQNKTCSDDYCVNRQLYFECNAAICPCGEKCENQRFQKREYPETQIIKTEDRGWALKTLEDIKEGRFVMEYCGELIDKEERKLRIRQSHDDNITNFYMLSLDKERTIDAGPKGNVSRFMNHSCQPNCITQKWNVNGDYRIGLFATCDIKSEEELTFNYNLECKGDAKTVCRCQAPNCSGFLGDKPKTEAELEGPKDKTKKKKKKKKRKPVEHEDECYRCGEGGKLVMCGKSTCPKSYHVDCLNLEKVPHGRWDCPWHSCDVCGKVAKKLCSECPNSFCNDHLDDNIFNTGESKLVCSEHQELLNVIRDSEMSSITKVEPSDEKSSMVSDSSEDSETSQSQSDSEASTVAPLKDVEAELKSIENEDRLDNAATNGKQVADEKITELKSIEASENENKSNNSAKNGKRSADEKMTSPPPAKKKRRSSKAKSGTESSESESISTVERINEAIKPILKSPLTSPAPSKGRGRPRKNPADQPSTPKTPKSGKKQRKSSSAYLGKKTTKSPPQNQSETALTSDEPSTLFTPEKNSKTKSKAKTPQDNHSKKTPKNKTPKGSSAKKGGKKAASVKSAPAKSNIDFDGKDSDSDFGDLVIDIPT